MILEADLPPAAAEALFRQPAIAARRAARSRGAAHGLTWLDTADGALAAEGLALEQPRRGQRRLLRCIPAPDAPWRPGTPPELVSSLPQDVAPAAAGGETLIPIAGFAGTLTRLALADDVEAALLKGRLRSVAEETPVARLTLSGPTGAVLATMRDLAVTLPLLPPRATLAEAARALARGTPLRPRRLGPPLLDPSVGVDDALPHALGHLVEVMLWHAPAARAGTAPEGVHQMRVAIRRARSLLRVFRPACDGPALRDLGAALKEIADALGPARDWDVWLGDIGADLAAALPEEPRIAALLRAARGQREDGYAALRPVLDGPALRRAAWDAVAVIETRPWRDGATPEAIARSDGPLNAFAAAVMDKRWRALAGDAEDILRLPDAEFHALRIEAKRMRYAAELFAPLWGRKRARRFLERLAAVQDAFGLANDAVVSHRLMAALQAKGAGMAWATGVAEGWALARGQRARSKSAQAWKGLRAAEDYWNQ
jgi:CHAD domain-containing protein